MRSASKPSAAIAAEDPRAPDVRRLLATHLAYARAQTPREDAHALDLDGLLDPAVRFFALRAGGELLAIGALKRLDDEHGEIKSMHTARAARGRGLGRAMLDHLLSTAHELGMRRVSLETGSMAAFAPARALYARAGFMPCGPFGDYALSINSAFMTLDLPHPRTSASPGLSSARALRRGLARRAPSSGPRPSSRK